MILANSVDFRLNILFLKGLNDSQVYAKELLKLSSRIGLQDKSDSFPCHTGS